MTCEDLPKELYVYDYDKKEIKLVAKDLFKGISPLILMNISNGQANFLVNGLNTETALVYQLDIQSKKLSLLFDGTKDEDNFMNYSKTISNLNLKIYQYLYFFKERGVYFEREIEPDYLNTFWPYEMGLVLRFFGWLLIKMYFKVVKVTYDGTYIRFDEYACSSEDTSEFLVALGKGFKPEEFRGEFKNRAFFFFRSKHTPVRFHPFILVQNNGLHKNLSFYSTGCGYGWADECMFLNMNSQL